MSDPFSHIGSFYSDLVRRFGYDVRATDWGSERSRRSRFDVLAEMDGLPGSSILDVGCGFADLLDYLTGRGIDVDYHGIDLSEEMIATGRARHPSADLRVANVMDLEGTGAFDFVIASGIFYLLRDDPYSVMETLVRRMFELSRRGIAFNSLSSWSDAPEPDEFYADPARVVELCGRISRKVVLRHDYHPGDFSVFVYR